MKALMKTIGGREFGFRTIPAEESVLVQVTVASVIGEPLFKALTQTPLNEEGKVDKAQMMAIFGAMVGLLTTKLNGKELLQLMKDVFKYVSVEGKPLIINEHFDHKPKEMWFVLWEALRFNYTDFLPANLFSSDLEELLSAN